MVNFDFKDRYSINDLLKIMEILRAPGGCPWDAQQTHESIRNDLIEETYEVIEAINKNDRELLLEELGDVLLQVTFHTQMERKREASILMMSATVSAKSLLNVILMFSAQSMLKALTRCSKTGTI